MSRKSNPLRAVLAAACVAGALAQLPASCPMSEGSYTYQLCGGLRPPCSSGLVCTALSSKCIPTYCRCDPSTGDHAGCTRMCANTTSMCLRAEGASTPAVPTTSASAPRACPGNVTLFMQPTSPCQDASMGPIDTELTAVCSNFPIQLSPMGMQIQAYGFAVSTGGVCWSTSHANCTAMAGNLSAYLASGARSVFGAGGSGCAVSPVGGDAVADCFVVAGDNSMRQFHATAACPGAAVTTTPAPPSTQTTCSCMMTLHAPVCANGTTYRNPCEALCAGFSSETYVTGVCGSLASSSTAASTSASASASSSSSSVSSAMPQCSSNSQCAGLAGAAYCRVGSCALYVSAGQPCNQGGVHPMYRDACLPGLVCQPPANGMLGASGVCVATTTAAGTTGSSLPSTTPAAAGVTTTAAGASGSSSSGGSGGATGTIVAVCVVVIAVVGVVGLVVLRRHTAASSTATHSQLNNVEMSNMSFDGSDKAHTYEDEAGGASVA